MKTTAIVGSEPTWKELLLGPLMNERGKVGDHGDDSNDDSSDDQDAADSDSSTDDKDAKDQDSSSDDTVPWDKDPRWKEWRGTEKQLKDVLEANKLESLDDLRDLIDEGSKIKGRIKDVGDIEDIIEKAATFDQYQEYWAQQEEIKKREGEDPEETIKRLETELHQKKEARKVEREGREEVEAANRAVRTYEKEVKSLVKDTDLDKEEVAFIAEFLGVGNQFNEIDITDSRAIGKLVADGLKKKAAYDQVVIKNYLAGKIEIPKVPASADTPSAKDPEVKNMKDARKIMKERLGKLFSG